LAVPAEAAHRPTVAIVGLGLIGASIGQALLARRAAASVVGFDTDPTRTDRAQQISAVTVGARHLSDAAHGADLVIVAVPTTCIPDVAAALRGQLAPHAVVTDTGSTKRTIVEQCTAALGERFVGGHPMAGHESSGPDHASPALMDDAAWLLTPTSVTSDRALAEVVALVAELGARPITMSPEEHDRLVAYVSHLPHAIAYALSACVRSRTAPGAQSVAAGSFASATRVASSDPSVWTAILMDNADLVTEAVSDFRSDLGAIERALADRDAVSLARLVASGFTGRR
jgi:prephenate dehydrogenase